jgi:hypothetical protein
MYRRASRRRIEMRCWRRRSHFLIVIFVHTDSWSLTVHPFYGTLRPLINPARIRRGICDMRLSLLLQPRCHPSTLLWSRHESFLLHLPAVRCSRPILLSKRHSHTSIVPANRPLLPLRSPPSLPRPEGTYYQLWPFLVSQTRSSST